MSKVNQNNNQRQPSPDEQKHRIMQFLAQKREQFSVSVLCSILQGDPSVKNEDAIARAVDIADGLMAKLYPIPEEKAAE